MSFKDIPTGILQNGQYYYLFILSMNPALFRLFKKKHLALFIIGAMLSTFNHRAILPILLLIILDLDYSSCDKALKQRMLFYFVFASAIISLFGGGV